MFKNYYHRKLCIFVDNCKNLIMRTNGMFCQRLHLPQSTHSSGVFTYIGQIVCLQEHKVLLSGTPLQNNVEELFSLLNFLEPTQFQSAEAFLVEFGNLQTEEQVSGV